MKHKQDKYFYANKINYSVYDNTIENVVPLYKDMHRTMINILKYYFSLGKGLSFKDIKGTVLDVGSGTGEESIGILKTFPDLKVFGVDFSEPMHNKYKNNAEDNKIQEERFKLFNYDILDREFVTIIREENNGYNFEIIISAFTIHHYTLYEKEDIYNKIYELLKKGGIFINGDLFNYRSKLFTDFAADYDETFIKESFKEDAYKKQNEQNKNLLKLGEAWLRHYEEDNILDSMEDQVDMLRKIGFTNVANPFRYWQVGVISGTK